MTFPTVIPDSQETLPFQSVSQPQSHTVPDLESPSVDPVPLNGQRPTEIKYRTVLRPKISSAGVGAILTSGCQKEALESPFRFNSSFWQSDPPKWQGQRSRSFMDKEISETNVRVDNSVEMDIVDSFSCLEIPSLRLCWRQVGMAMIYITRSP